MNPKFIHYYPRAMVGNGGPTVAAWSWVRALFQAGHDVTMVYDSDLSGRQPLMVEGVRAVPLDHRLAGRWRYPRGMQSILDERSVVVLHSAFLAGNLVMASAANAAGARAIFVPHGAYEQRAMQRNALLKRLWLQYEGVAVNRAFAVHAFVSTETESIRKVAPRVPIITVPTPIGVPQGRTWTGGGGYIAWFGRYDIEHKGLDLLIEAYSRLPAKQRLPVRLHGRDSTNTRLEVEELVKKAGLADVVSVGGPIGGEEKNDFLVKAELFLMPSRWESLSIALLEALALNVPCLVSSNMPIAGQLAEERACIVSAVDPSTMADALEHFLSAREATTSSLKPREFVERHLTHRVVGARFVAQVRSLWDGR